MVKQHVSPKNPETYRIDNRRWSEAQAHEMSFWNREGVFENEFQRVRDRYGPILSEVESHIERVRRTLDVGSGPTCAGRLFSTGQKFFLDPLMSAYQERWPDRMPQGRQGVCVAAKGEYLPYSCCTFDVVCSFNSLDHMHRPWEVLREVRRVLKKGGIFLLGIFCHPPLIAYSRLGLEKAVPFLKDTAHPFSYTRSSIKRLVEKVLVVKESRCVYRKPSLWPGLHRSDWVFLCENVKTTCSRH